MTKLFYILSLYAVLLLLDSCSKERITKCDDIDPFATQENDLSRGQLGGGTGGILDPDEDDDDLDDDDQIVDPDEDDDDMDDDDEEITDDERQGGSEGQGV